MQITREDLGKIAKTLLAVLDEQRVATPKDIGRLNGTSVSRRVNFGLGEQEGRVLFELGPSPENKFVVVRYQLRGSGVPIEVKVNQSGGYIHMLLTSMDEIPGYASACEDDFGNTVQTKSFRSTDYAVVRTELELLGELDRSERGSDEDVSRSRNL